jgi:hypothetical protein
LFVAKAPKYAGATNPSTKTKAGFFGALSSLLGGSQTPTYQTAEAVQAEAAAATPAAEVGFEGWPLEAQVSAVLQSPGRIVVTIVIEEPGENASQSAPPSPTP